jgi:hypothetical protein
MFLDRQLAEQPDDEHRAVWRWLSEVAAGYPIGVDVPPLKPPEGPGRGHLWGALDVVSVEVPGEPYPTPLRVDCVSAGRAVSADQLDAPGGAERLAAVLFARRARGTAWVLGHGGRRDLHILFRRFYQAWLSLGYEVAPVVQGGDVKLVSVRRHKHSWYLVDWHGLTGLDPACLLEQTRALAGVDTLRLPRSVGLALAVDGYAALVRAAFGVEARLTLGQTAVAAAARHVPSDGWLWRPNALALALCREGAGFRGGYCYYPAYRGPGHKVDIRRAYAWAISQPLPGGGFRGECVADGVERSGVYVCRVRGPGELPVYVGVWGHDGPGFARRLWSGDSCLCVLSTAEIGGMRALGYRVEPGWGYVHWRTFTLAGYAQAADAVTREHGADSVQGQAAKLLVNAVYGKLAERPERDGLVFSAKAPSKAHLPYVDSAGEEIDGAWCEATAAYRAHQHVDVAAHITALVRGRLYEAMGRLSACGITVLAADTDGLLLSHNPHGALELEPTKPGGWRYCGYDADLVISGPRFAVWRGRAITAGTTRQSPDVVALAYERGVVSVEGKVMAPPWQGGAIARTVRKRLRRGA